MTRVAVGALLSIVFTATASAQTPDQIKQGQAAYTAQKCGVCHSIGGTGNKKGPLDDVGVRLSADQIRQWIVDAPAMSAKAKSARKPPMKAYTLAKEDLDGLVAYLSSLNK